MGYSVKFTETANGELRAIRAFERLTTEPTIETRNRKMMSKVVANFEFREPLWELRIGEYRAFYDVDEGRSEVTICAVRRKFPHQTTEEVTNA